MPGWWSPEQLAQLEQVNTAREALRKADLKIQPTSLEKTLDTADTLDAIRKIVDEALKREYEAVKDKIPPLKEKENAILSAYAILYPTEAVNNRLAVTGRTAERVTQQEWKIGVQELLAINKWWDKEFTQFSERMKNTPEWFTTKGELMMYFEVLEKMPNWEWVYKEKVDQVKAIIKSVLNSFLEAMFKNGVSIDNPKDLDFLKKYGSPEVQNFIGKKPELNTYDGKIKYSLRKDGNDLKLEPIITGKSITPWVDITKLNTVELAKWTPGAKEQIVQGMNTDQIKDFIKTLRDSNIPGMKLISELFRIFLGIKNDGEKKEGWRETLSKKDKKVLLDSMSTPTDRYDLSKLFDAKSNKLIDEGSKGSQEYLKDAYKLLDKAPPKEWEKYTYDETLIDLIKKYEKSVWLEAAKQTWKLDKEKVDLIRGKMDANGEVKATAEVVPEPLKQEKHPLGDRIVALEGKSLSAIKALLRRDPIPKVKVEEIQADLGFTRESTNKETKLDGNLWPATVKAFLNRYPKGMRNVSTPPQSAAQT